MTTFAERVIRFNKQLSFSKKLPRNIRVMNPFQDNPEILSIAKIFYKKFYNDTKKRKFILGINPGRLGAGVTGIPFTDSKRLQEICKIKIESVTTHEPSSVFVYDLIQEYGGPEKFYSNFYINSTCPLGFIERNERHNWINRNYYDYNELFLAMENFITKSLKRQVALGIDTDTCFVLGKKNAKYVKLINDKEKFFKSLVILEHPRYIVQYRSKQKDTYITDFLSKLKS